MVGGQDKARCNDGVQPAQCPARHSSYHEKNRGSRPLGGARVLAGVPFRAARSPAVPLLLRSSPLLRLPPSPSDDVAARRRPSGLGDGAVGSSETATAAAKRSRRVVRPRVEPPSPAARMRSAARGARPRAVTTVGASATRAPVRWAPPPSPSPSPWSSFPPVERLRGPSRPLPRGRDVCGIFRFSDA